MEEGVIMKAQLIKEEGLGSSYFSIEITELDTPINGCDCIILRTAICNYDNDKHMIAIYNELINKINK